MRVTSVYRRALAVAVVAVAAGVFVPSVSASTSTFWNNPAGFTSALGGTALDAHGFDAVPVDTNVEGQSFAGAVLRSCRVDLGDPALSCDNPAVPSNPLLVEDGNSTFTSSSGYTNVSNRSTNRLFPTTASNVVSPGGLELPPGPDPGQRDSMSLTFDPPVNAFAFDILYQSWDNSLNTVVRVTSTLGVETLPVPNAGPSGSPPGRAVFAGFVSTSEVTRVDIIESDENNNHPDSNIGLDTLQVRHSYARPKGATPFRVPLVVAYVGCTSESADRTHGPPLEHPSCSGPTQSSGYLTVGTPDANGNMSNAQGFVRYDAIVGAPGGTDDSDVALAVNFTDVREQESLADYAGELQAISEVRITDRLDGSSTTEPATVSDIELPVTVPCTTTASSMVGSTCSIATTLDAISGGSIPEGKRSIWELGRIRVDDGGPDGQAGTTPNTVFATQGVFIP